MKIVKMKRGFALLMLTTLFMMMGGVSVEAKTIVYWLYATGNKNSTKVEVNTNSYFKPIYNNSETSISRIYGEGPLPYNISGFTGLNVTVFPLKHDSKGEIRFTINNDATVEILPYGRKEGMHSLLFDNTEYSFSNAAEYIPTKPIRIQVKKISGNNLHIIKKGPTSSEIGILYVKVTEQIDADRFENAGEQVLVGEALHNQGVTLYVGGWKYQSNSEQADKYTRHTTGYINKGEKAGFVDSWDETLSQYNVGDEDPYKRHNNDAKLITNSFSKDSKSYQYYSYGKDNARNEFTEGQYWGRYDFTETPKTETYNGKTYDMYSGEKAVGNPFTVPCFGCFVKIEPDVNGKITLHILQNSTIDFDASSSRGETKGGGNEDEQKSGTLESGASWRPIFIVDERGTRLGETDVKATTDTEHTIGRADETALIYNSVDDSYQVYCVKLVDKEGNPITGKEEESDVQDGEIADYYYENKGVKNAVYKGRTDYFEAKDSGNGLGKSDEGNNAKYDYVYLTDSDYNNKTNKTYVRRITFKESIEEEKPFVEGLKAKFNKDKFKTFFSQSFPVYYKDNTLQEEVPYGTEDAHIEIVEVWPEHVRGDGSNITDKQMQRVWGPKYTGDGWMIISKGYVNYEFEVKAGKSYYFFSNDTKFGFCGYEFSPDEAPTSTLTLNENGRYTKNNNESGYIGETTISGYKGEYATVVLERSFHAGWNAICLPFSVTESKMREWFGTEEQDIEDYELVTYNGAKLLIDEDSEKYADPKYKDKLRAHFFRHVYQDIVAGIPYMLYIPKDAKAANLKEGEYVTFNNITIENDVTMKYFTTSYDNMPFRDESKVNPNKDKNKKLDNKNIYLQAYGYNDLDYLYKKGDADDYTSVGNYTPVYPDRGSYLVLEKGIQLYDEATPVQLKGFRSYLNPGFDPGTFSSLARIASTNFTNLVEDMEDDWNATVINDLLAEELGFFNRPANVYSVSGQLVRANSTSLVGLPKGIYIVNGKKYLVK